MATPLDDAREGSTGAGAPIDGQIDDLFKSLIERAVPYLAEILKASAGIASEFAVVAPHVGNLILAYRQKRADRNLRRLLTELGNRISRIEDRLSHMDQSLRDEIREKVFPSLLDFVHDEPEIEKVPYYAAGFEIILETRLPTRPHLVFSQLAELLSQLSHVELLVLSEMAVHGNWGFSRNLEEYGLTPISLAIAQQKLHRLNLLIDTNEEKSFEHLKLLDDTVRQLMSKHPQIGIRANNIGFYSKPDSPRYEVSETGRRLLRFCEFKNIG